MQFTEILLYLAVTSIALQSLVHGDIELTSQMTSLIIDIMQDKSFLILTTDISHVRIEA